VEITIRRHNLEIPDALRQAIDEKVGHLSRYLEGMERAEVRLTEEHNPRISEPEVCEVTVFGHGHIVRAKACASDPHTAVDKVVDKLQHQLEKLKGRLVGRSHPRRPVAKPDNIGAELPEDAVLNGHGRIVKTKSFEIEAMSPEEAALKMDLLGHDFFFFTNAETQQPAVVYERADGNVGLIDAT
jgi:putative sigma-54 modulation protein